MILCLKTDAPTAELYLYDGSRVIATKVWDAHRTLARDLLKTCQELLREAGSDFPLLEGIVIFRGPGSFTGLRIGCTVANTIAYSEQIPIVGTIGESWREDGITRLESGENDTQVMPEYGAPPRITQPKK